jgi:hypothetical protein
MRHVKLFNLEFLVLILIIHWSVYTKDLRGPNPRIAIDWGYG